jgi:hypothetical protein
LFEGGNFMAGHDLSALRSDGVLSSLDAIGEILQQEKNVHSQNRLAPAQEQQPF